MTPSLRHTALTGTRQKRPFSIAQAARAWGMSEGALRRRVRCGLIEAVRASAPRCGAALFIEEETVQSLRAARWCGEQPETPRKAEVVTK